MVQARSCDKASEACERGERHPRLIESWLGDRIHLARKNTGSRARRSARASSAPFRDMYRAPCFTRSRRATQEMMSPCHCALPVARGPLCDGRLDRDRGVTPPCLCANGATCLSSNLAGIAAYDDAHPGDGRRSAWAFCAGPHPWLHEHAVPGRLARGADDDGSPWISPVSVPQRSRPLGTPFHDALAVSSPILVEDQLLRVPTFKGDQ